MKRKQNLVVSIPLTLAVLLVLQHSALPLPAARPTPPAAPLAAQGTAIPPASAAVRDFTVYAPLDRAALDERAELLLDN